MAVETYGVTQAMVLTNLPINADSVTANSRITPDDLDDFVEQGAAAFTGTFKNTDIPFASLGDDAQRQVQDAILDYVSWRVLAVLNARDEVKAPYLERYQAALDGLRASPNNLGDFGSPVNTNVNTSSPQPRKFTRNYGW